MGACDLPLSKSPDDLLKGILSASKSKASSTLETLLVKKDTTPGFPIHDALMKFIRRGDRKHLGDFSYSDEALKRLLRQTPLKWTTPSEEDLSLFRKFEGLKTLDRSRFLKHRSGDVNITLVEIEEGRWQLLFWEGLNTLLSADASDRS